MDSFDVIVIGGGHAGCEAAAAATRLGAHTLLVTMRRDQIGAMSCNPAIGGLGKGHLVREVDAWDGVIARAADAAAIHHRMLNRSKGPAVWGPRIQADRELFRDAVQRCLADYPGLSIREGEVESLDMAGGGLTGIVVSGTRVEARAIVMATGTFLGATLHCGTVSRSGGRAGERASVRLAEQIAALGLPVARLKTGTPPRLDGRTIVWSRLGWQPSDAEPWTMSSLPSERRLPQLACAIARTNSRTHDLIRASMDRSPLRTGAIGGRGPRYCPSIEDKVERFGDRDGHQIFLEPEGLDTPLIYPNGISTSLPEDAQQAMINSIDGLEETRIVAPGYAVEYAHIDPRALDRTLAVRDLPGLFLAGQVNGTTGYEEAAAQGLVAGLNAACHALNREPILFDRASSYIGVMVDDLRLHGVSEPYRMLTGRAEFRLRLRADNACTRLTGRAIEAGAVRSPRAAHHQRVEALRARLMGGGEAPAGEADILQAVSAEVEVDAQYAPYVARQDREVARLLADEAVRLPGDIGFDNIPGLSSEMIERLQCARPSTIGEASRIAGVTPAALSAIMIHARKAA